MQPKGIFIATIDVALTGAIPFQNGSQFATEDQHIFYEALL